MYSIGDYFFMNKNSFLYYTGLTIINNVPIEALIKLL